MTIKAIPEDSSLVGNSKFEIFCQQFGTFNYLLDEKILIVDDQQINIMALKIILKLQGIKEVDSANYVDESSDEVEEPHQ